MSGRLTPTWRDLFVEEVERQRGQLQGRGLSGRRLDERARRDAEVVLNTAINTEIERRRRAGLPLAGLVDEVRS